MEIDNDIRDKVNIFNTHGSKKNAKQVMRLLHPIIKEYKSIGVPMEKIKELIEEELSLKLSIATYYRWYRYFSKEETPKQEINKTQVKPRRKNILDLSKK